MDYFKPSYGSGVSLKSMSLADAAFRICEHDTDEVKCPACKRNHDAQMGRVAKQAVEESTNPQPIYVEWGRPMINDIVTSDGHRLANTFRELASGLGYDLRDTLVDFQPGPNFHEIHISRGMGARQMWVRLPHPYNRVLTLELAKTWCRVIQPLLESGRKQEWVRTKRLPAYNGRPLDDERCPVTDLFKYSCSHCQGQKSSF